MPNPFGYNTSPSGKRPGGPVWGTTKDGKWKFAPTREYFSLRGKQCGKVKYLYEFEATKFWRPGQVITKKAGQGRKLRVADPCICTKQGRPLSRRLIELVQSGQTTIEAIKAANGF